MNKNNSTSSELGQQKKSDQQAEPSEQKESQEPDAYRTLLISSWFQSQDDCDRLLFLLSSGALGISFAFVNNFIVEGEVHWPLLLFSAWVSWSFSLTAVLFSYISSIKAHRKAIDEYDKKGKAFYSVDEYYDKLTRKLNNWATGLFVVGLFLMIGFVGVNLGSNQAQQRNNMTKEKNEEVYTHSTPDDKKKVSNTLNDKAQTPRTIQKRHIDETGRGVPPPKKKDD